MAPGPPSTATLLERDAELAALRDVLAQARQERGRLVLIEAPAGIGKTSLLRFAATEAAANGFTLLRARATELERDYAYGIVRQLLEPAVTRLAGASSERAYAGAAGLARPLFDPTTDVMPTPSTDRSFAMLHGLFWLINNLTEDAPVLLSVDDLQWADPASLRFLNYLVPRLDGLRLALIAATRPEEGRRTEITRIAAGAESVVLEPGVLSLEATATLCAQRLDVEVEPAFAAACREATGGNPFLLEALLREVAERRLAADQTGAEAIRTIGPTAVARAVLLRLSDRPAAATALVRAVAILGDGTTIAEAIRAAGLSQHEGNGSADLLIALGLLRLDDGLEFVHPIVREAVYTDMSPLDRADAHARAAGLLVELGAPGERIAAQICHAPPIGDPDRVELLRRVAATAVGQGAPATAASWLERALAEPPPSALRGEILLELSSARLRLGAPEAAIEPLTTAITLIEDRTLRMWATRLLGSAQTWSGRADAAVETITEAIASIERDDRELALLLEADRAAYAQQASLGTRAPVAAALGRHAELAGVTPGERLVLAGLGFEHARSSETEREAAADIEGVLANGKLVEEQALDVAGTLYLLLLGLLATDSLDLLDARIAQMLVEARARASIPAQAFILEFRGWASLRRGDVPQAEEDARLALELLTTSNIRLGQLDALGLLIEALIEQGESEAAEESLLRYEGQGPIAPSMANNAFLEARSHLRLAQGRTREGFDGLVEFGRHDELWGGANPLASRWRSAASIALAGVGEQEAARQLVAEDLERARRWGSVTGVGVALRAMALVDHDRDAVGRLEESANVLETSPARLEHARVLVDLGAALRRANRRGEARRTLERGLQLARRCGARRLIDLARTELRAAGGRSSERPGSGIDELTASERRVAELAADGHSNPEIAQELFVTRKTVETHLGHVYQKLAISGRGKLARALASRGSPVA